jgi:hypothetical protein
MIERAVLSLYKANGHNLRSRPDRFNDPYVAFTIQNQLQILLASFVEEWGRFSALAKDNLDVRETLRQVQPSMDRFKGWPDLRSVRSKVLAHPFRTKSGELLMAPAVLRSSKAPTTLAETLLLGFCALLAVDRVKARHSAEQAAAEQEMLAEDRSIQEQGIRTAAELEREFYRINEEMRRTKDGRA